MNLNLTYSEAPAPAGVAASTQNTTTLASPSKGWHGLVVSVLPIASASAAVSTSQGVQGCFTHHTSAASLAPGSRPACEDSPAGRTGSMALAPSSNNLGFSSCFSSCFLQWHVRDVEGATILLWDMITATPHLTQGADKRKALTQLVRRG
jgi:hypothetical protein